MLKWLHEALAHTGESDVRATARYYKLGLRGQVPPCASCALGKGRQKNVSKKLVPRAEEVGYRLHIDQSTVKAQSLGGNNNFLLVLDDCSDFIWTYFLKTKDMQVEVIVGLIKHLAAKYKKVVKFI